MFNCLIILLSSNAPTVPLATEGWDAAIPPTQIPAAGIEGAAPATGWEWGKLLCEMLLQWYLMIVLDMCFCFLFYLNELDSGTEVFRWWVLGNFFMCYQWHWTSYFRYLSMGCAE